MKRCTLSSILVIICLLVITRNASAQKRTLYDDFSDGTLNGIVKWSGNTRDFKVVSQNENYLLRLDAKNAGIARLSTPSIAAFGSWSFFMELNFPPSKSNHAEVFLTSNKADLNDHPSGYAVTAGENGNNDVFHLVRIDTGSIANNIINGKTNISTGGRFRIKVTRNTSGMWKLYVAKEDSSLNPDGTGKDRTYTSSKYFGLKLSFTSTRTNKFYFDDFQIIKDPVFLLRAKSINNFSADVYFSEPIVPGSVNIRDFTLDHEIGFPSKFKIINPDTVQLIFPKSIPSGKYYLTVNHIKDFSGQTIADNSKVNVVFTDVAKTGDVAISEFMYNPPAGLPEYVELYNNSDKLLNLENWQLKDNTEIFRAIANEPYYFKPHQYLVISQDTTLMYDWFGHRAYLQMNNFPSLNNDFDSIRLINPQNAYIDSLSYAFYWGGQMVALERKSYRVAAHYQENWGNSPSKLKGTPGEKNLIEPDTTPPTLKSTHLIDGRHIQLKFSEILNKKSAENRGSYDFYPTVAIDSISSQKNDVQLVFNQKLRYKTPYRLTLDSLNDLFGNSIKPVTVTLIYAPDITPPKILSAFYSTGSDTVYLNCNEDIRLNAQSYFKSSSLEIRKIQESPTDSSRLMIVVAPHPDSKKDDYMTVRKLYDQHGNALNDTTVVIARTGKKGDLVINEIMYNPIADPHDYRPDQCEYVEIYNRGSHTISLNGYHIHDAPDENGKVNPVFPINTLNKEISPGRYAVIYADTSVFFKDSRMAKFFTITADSDNFMQAVRTTLSLSSKKGAVFLANKYGLTMDSVYYSDTWQNPNLTSDKGISLERVNPYIKSNDPSNWSSSAVPKGGTPGRQNSIFYQASEYSGNAGIHVEPNPFSPDGDGYNDNLMISYSLKDPNDLLNIRIYDRYGRLIRKLAEGKKAGKTGTVIWDGFNDNHQPNRIGIYIIWFEAYDYSTGSREIFKKTVVLARHL